MGGDLALIWNDVSADFGVAANDLVTDDGLRTAVVLSLFTDRRSDVGDPLPDAQSDRRGWWADAVPVVDGDQIGSRLWLLDRAKQTQSVLDLAESYSREALQWMLDDSVAADVGVVASFPARGVIRLDVQIQKPTTDTVKYQFQSNWAAEGAR